MKRSASDEDMAMQVEEQDEKKDDKPRKRSVYLPGHGSKCTEPLEFDRSAYVMIHEAYTEAPCMSFDIIRDNIGDNRATYPHTAYVVAGTQAVRRHDNKILIMKWSNICKTFKSDQDDEEESSSSSDEEIPSNLSSKMPVMSCSTICHYGCINRLRNTQHYDTILTAVWSETNVVGIFDLKDHIKAVDNESKARVDTHKKRKLHSANNQQTPLFSFSGHSEEGYAIDWSPTVPGLLATGDCANNIHIWTPQESTWHVDLRPFKNHTGSVEDIQWSPNENSVFASCSVDKSIKIWDIRHPPSKSCMLSVNAHSSDVNSIHWNRMKPFIVSGGEDGIVNIWDLRQFKDDSAIVTFKHHSNPVSSVEWHPTEDSVFASSDSDQTALWDLSVERDDENNPDEVKEVPPQLMFMHLGQEDVKEVHWHPQIPGMVITTAQNNFNIFQTISI